MAQWFWTPGNLCMCAQLCIRTDKLFHWHPNHLSSAMWTKRRFFHRVLFCSSGKVSHGCDCQSYRNALLPRVVCLCESGWFIVETFNQNHSQSSVCNAFVWGRGCVCVSKWRLNTAQKSTASYREENTAKSLLLNQCNALYWLLTLYESCILVLKILGPEVYDDGLALICS